MNRDQAFDMMLSDKAEDRFKAAVNLVTTATAEDLSRLLQLRSREKDSYVLARLNSAIAACSSKQAPEISSRLSAQTDSDYKHQQAIEEVSGMLLHEIGSKLGLVALNCSLEIKDYNNSKTAVHVRNLQSIFNAIGLLRSAANPSVYELFDLASIIQDIVNIEANGRSDDVALHGPRPLLIHSSSHLVRLAFGNGIRNAIEAALPASSKSQEYPVVVNWGVNDVSYWISVIDSGPGIASVAKNLIFAMGGTTKKQHLGFGMAIARQAMNTLGGTVVLENSLGGGARFEMRWERTNENING